MMKGVIDFLVSDEEEAQILRQNCVFKIVPMMNPDGVIHGNYRTCLSGSDLNRKWKKPSKTLHPTVFYTKEMIKEFAKNRNFLYCCDLHGHSRKPNAFVYGNTNQENGTAPKVYPYILSKLSKYVSYKDSTFAVQKSKETTARISLWREVPCDNIFTIEGSFHGYVEDGKINAFTIQDYINVGRDICKGLFVYVSYIVLGHIPIPRIPYYSEEKKRPVSPKSTKRMVEAIKSLPFTPPQILDELKICKTSGGGSDSEDSGSDSNPSGDELPYEQIAKVLPQKLVVPKPKVSSPNPTQKKNSTQETNSTMQTNRIEKSPPKPVGEIRSPINFNLKLEPIKKEEDGGADFNPNDKHTQTEEIFFRARRVETINNVTSILGVLHPRCRSNLITGGINKPKDAKFRAQGMFLGKTFFNAGFCLDNNDNRNLKEKNFLSTKLAFDSKQGAARKDLLILGSRVAESERERFISERSPEKFDKLILANEKILDKSMESKEIMTKEDENILINQVGETINETTDDVSLKHNQRSQGTSTFPILIQKKSKKSIDHIERLNETEDYQFLREKMPTENMAANRTVMEITGHKNNNYLEALLPPRNLHENYKTQADFLELRPLTSLIKGKAAKDLMLIANHITNVKAALRDPNTTIGGGGTLFQISSTISSTKNSNHDPKLKESPIKIARKNAFSPAIVKSKLNDPRDPFKNTMKATALDWSDKPYRERGSVTNITPPLDVNEANINPLSFQRGKRNSDHSPLMGSVRSNSMQSKSNSKYISVLLTNDKPAPGRLNNAYGLDETPVKRNFHKSRISEYGTPNKRNDEARLSSSFMLDDNSYKKKRNALQLFSSPGKY